MDGVNEALLERLRKKFEVDDGDERKQLEETTKKIDEFSRSLESLRSEIILNRATIEEIKNQVAGVQIPPAEVKSEDIRAIEKKIDDLTSSFESLRSDITSHRLSIEELKSHTADIKTTFKAMTESKEKKKEKKEEKEEKEEDLEERFVISTKTGVIEKVKGKKIEYIEAEATGKKEQRIRGKKGDIIEAEDNTPLSKGGSLFKRLKNAK